MVTRFSQLHIVLYLVGMAAPAAIATDWSQWRGPERDGYAPGVAWPQSLTDLEPIWRVPLGKGYPGPVVTADKVFVVETVDRNTVGVRALARDTGALLWRTTWPSSGSVLFSLAPAAIGYAQRRLGTALCFMSETCPR